MDRFNPCKPSNATRCSHIKFHPGKKTLFSPEGVAWRNRVTTKPRWRAAINQDAHPWDNKAISGINDFIWKFEVVNNMPAWFVASRPVSFSLSFVSKLQDVRNPRATSAEYLIKLAPWKKLVALDERGWFREVKCFNNSTAELILYTTNPSSY